MHQGEDQSPRDDLFSVMYVFLDLLCGSLPWSQATRVKDRPAVSAKKKYYLEHQDKLVQWVATQVESAEEGLGLQTVPPGNVNGGNFPVHAQRSTLKLLEYMKGLEYEDQPDYDRIIALLCGCVKVGAVSTGTEEGIEVGEETDEPTTMDELKKMVGHADYTLRGFSWKDGCENHFNSTLFSTGTRVGVTTGGSTGGSIRGTGGGSSSDMRSVSSAFSPT